MLLVGVDLAWGERNRDGVCLLEAAGPSGPVSVVESRWTLGDGPLFEWLEARAGAAPCLVAVDAPLVCPNREGSRPVDRLTHRLFGRQHAGCHPSNARLCARPLRIARGLQARGFELGWDTAVPRLAMEVYPHPAMVRWFGLARILKYKRGAVAERRREFRRYQSLLRSALQMRFAEVDPGPVGGGLLESEPSKEAEDRLDAFFCALIALHHWRHQGGQSQILGDSKSGFLVLPQ
jgi:predicted RNase H-like nuclease